jgi:FkbM family methyltransferase
MLIRLKDKIKNTIYKWVPPPLVNESFSQSGEDVIVDFLFNQLGIKLPKYLEIGVCKPITGSNTYRFYKRGSNGVLVEADKSQIENIKKVRPKDHILNIGISSGEKRNADFYIFDEKGYNTFSKEEAILREKNSRSKIVKIESVELKNINEILSENFTLIPDFLSLDIEGLDFEVLKSLDYTKFTIPVICVETCTFSENHIRPKDKRIEEFMISKGYFVYADTYINTIFVNEYWFNNFK